MSPLHEEFLSLVSLYCDEQLSADQLERLQSLLRSSSDLQSDFIEYIQLHGQLLWDGGLTAGRSFESVPDELMPSELASDHALSVVGAGIYGDLVPSTTAGPRRSPAPVSSAGGRRIPVMTVLVGVVAAAVVALAVRPLLQTDAGSQLAEASPGEQPTVSGDEPRTLMTEMPRSPVMGGLSPLKLEGISGNDGRTNDQSATALLTEATNEVSLPDFSDDSSIVQEIDRLIKIGWDENNVRPAAPSSDHEWVRRTYLALTGRIPTIEEVSEFVDSDSPRKRDLLVSDLLASRTTAENLAVTWTNLLIGRSNSRQVDEQSLFEFLLEQFAENQSWMDTVGKLVSAEGRSDENGATNFLLAHLNDQATPATAVTARLFLGRQVHCTQCHDHPFAKERRQDEFWSLNAFFKQAERSFVNVTGKDGKQRQVLTLADAAKSGMTFYDTLRGHKKAVLPEFAGESLPADFTSSRRAELVRLLAADDEHQVARAMVNRMWSQFFGYGFTNPVDDLGPHNPVSHPELLEHLTKAFVQSDYDLRRLMKWMTMSEAFQLSSIQQSEALALDDPDEGGTPLFSRAYPRHMGPEQVYESIRTAIRSVSSQPLDSSLGTEHRREWVEQFVYAYGTDENNERLAFDGNISQALLMMNGEDLETAIPLAAGEVIRVLRDSAVTQTPWRLAMATLNRIPTENEEKAFRNRYRSLVRSVPPEEAVRTATEDLLWAYLNSSEFVSVH